LLILHKVYLLKLDWVIPEANVLLDTYC